MNDNKQNDPDDILISGQALYILWFVPR